jgi:hypothetical protein
LIPRVLIKFALPAAALVAIVLPAQATTVNYSTTGVITCAGCTGSGTDSVTFGPLTMTYIPIAAGTVNANPTTNASAGEIRITDTSTANTPINGTFALSINQTAPSAGSGPLDSGTLTGSLASNNSTAILTFTDSTLNLGGIEYQLDSFSFGTSYVLVPPSSGGITSLEMNVTSTLPEPTFMALTAFGFAGMGVVAFRRRRRA